MRIAPGLAWLAVFALWGLPAGAQNYRGEATPVTQRADRIEFYRLRFLTFVFGHEGPMDMPLPTPPVSGREYFVEADVFGIESVATIRFELVDSTGRSLQTLNMWKSSDGGSDGEFYGFVTVPGQPFRVVASGTNINGTLFRSTAETSFQPIASGPPEPSMVPPGIPPNRSAQLERMVVDYSRQMRTRATEAAAAHPGGVITLAPAIVSRITYEPLDSGRSAIIGMRLRYSIQFPSRQTVAAMPHVFPAYTTSQWRGMVTMKGLRGTITPMPLMLGAQSLKDVIVYGASATYEAGVTYNFAVDMVPDYVFQGEQTGRFCIHEQKFTNREMWNALIDSQSAVSYSISITDTKTYATVPIFFPQRTFYEGFKAGGAFDCGPVPNIRF